MNLQALKTQWLQSQRKLEPAILNPILPLSQGHLGLALASGVLDGLVTLADGQTVVVKGICTKGEYERSSETKKVNTREGVKVEKTKVMAEKASLKIRVLDQQGNITDYTN